MAVNVSLLHCCCIKICEYYDNKILLYFFLSVFVLFEGVRDPGTNNDSDEGRVEQRQTLPRQGFGSRSGSLRRLPRCKYTPTSSFIYVPYDCLRKRA